MKRSPLKRQSVKRAKQTVERAHRNRIPDDVRSEVEHRSWGACELSSPLSRQPAHECTGKATEMHHKLMRSQGGKHTAENLMHLCGNAHRFVHANPALSYEHGWLVRGGGIPQERAS